MSATNHSLCETEGATRVPPAHAVRQRRESTCLISVWRDNVAANHLRLTFTEIDHRPKVIKRFDSDAGLGHCPGGNHALRDLPRGAASWRSEEHTSEL